MSFNQSNALNTLDDDTRRVFVNKRNVFDFLRSNALKSLIGEGYTGSISEREEIEIESEPGGIVILVEGEF